MEIATPRVESVPTETATGLFKGPRNERELGLLREQMRQKLHPISCRICRQELSYYRDVGRFPLEESEVQGAYRQGRGYRFLLTVWWRRVADHLPLDLKEMPAVSSYYRHMSYHLGVRTEREPTPAEPVEEASQPGGYASAPAVAAPAFPTVVSVPVPDHFARSEAPSFFDGGILDAAPASATRAPAMRSGGSVLRMAQSMAQIQDLTAARPSGARSAPDVLGRAAQGSSTSGGYAVRVMPLGSPARRRRRN